MAGIISLIAGAFTGGGFSLITKGLDMFDRRLRDKQDLRSRELDYAHELVLLSKRSELAAAERESELEIAVIDGQAATLSASYAHDASYGPTSQTVSNILRFFRPALTLLLLIVSVLGVHKLIASGNADAALIATSVDSLLYLTTLAISWWFGDRGFEKCSAGLK